MKFFKLPNSKTRWNFEDLLSYTPGKELGSDHPMSSSKAIYTIRFIFKNQKEEIFYTEDKDAADKIVSWLDNELSLTKF